MSLNKKLTNRPFFSEFEKPITEKGHIYYKVSSKIFSKNGLDKGIVSVTPSKSSGNCDCFVVECKDKDYILKISLDDKDPYLINESLFYKNNQDPSLCRYVDSGIIKIGDDIRFILLEDDLGFDLNEVGALHLIEESEGFMFSFINQKKFTATNNFSDYIDNLKEETDINNLSASTLLSINQYQDSEKLKTVIDELRLKINEAKDEKLLTGFDFCHGGLNAESISSMEGLFKFCDFGQCFLGNQLMDIALMSFNLGYQEREFNDVSRSYCKFSGIDYESNKDDFRGCLKFAYSIHLLQLVYEFIIEQCIYKNSREEKLIYLVKKYTNSLWGSKRSDLSETSEQFIKSMIEKTVDFDEDLRLKYGVEN